MRLNGLQLNRFGMFANRNLEFPAVDSASPDFHIIYGDNEAGKSTALAAWLDFLFGMKPKSPYAFLHGAPSLQVGAHLQDESGVVELVRSKGMKDSLRFPDGNVVHGRLIEMLGGLDRTQYELIFTVNDDTLEKGGEEIVNSRGDLGRLLYSATTGLAGLTNRLQSLESECDGFFRPRARKMRLKEITDEMGSIVEEHKIALFSVDAYTRLANDERVAAGELEDIRTKLERTSREYHLVDSRLKALSTYNQLRDNRAGQEEIGHLPPPPDDWRETCQEIARKRSLSLARIQQLEAGIIRLEEDLASQAPNETALAYVGEIEGLEEKKARYSSARNDLPRRQAEHEELEHSTRVLRDRLGLQEIDGEDTFPPDDEIAHIRDLVERHSGITGHVQSTGDEHANASDRLKEITRRLEGKQDRTGNIRQLETILDRLQRDDPIAERRRLQSRLEEIRAGFEEQLLGLQPWSGSGSDLAGLSVPEIETVGEWKNGISLLESRITENEESRAACADRISRIRAQIDATTSGSTVTYQQLATARSQREKSWASHREQLDRESADRFEQDMREHDELVNRYVDDRARESELSERRLKLAELETERDTLDRSGMRLRESRDRTLRQVISATDGLFPDLSADEILNRLHAWLPAHARAVSAWSEMKRLGDRIATLDRETGQLCDNLARSLRVIMPEIDPELSPDALIAHARDLIRQHHRNAQLREQLSEAESDLQQRKEAHDRAISLQNEWQEDWKAACALAVFSRDVPPVKEMNARLDCLGELRSVLERKRQLKHRIDGMSENMESFLRQLDDIADRLELRAPNPIETWQAVNTSIRTARDRKRDVTRIGRELAEQRDELEVNRIALRQHDDQVTRMGRPYGITDIDKLQPVLNRADRLKSLKDQERSLIKSLRDFLQSDDIDTLLDELQAVDRSELEARRDSLGVERDGMNNLCIEKQNAHNQLRMELERIGGDDEVARLDARLAHLEIRLAEEATAHLRRRLGIFAVNAEIRKFMDSHRSGMMDKASHLFRTITGGAYTGLETSFEDSSENLLAISASGGTKRVDGLSKGTRFQLYLALRLAGIHETLKSSSHLPFIADDVLETFDDNRTGQTLLTLQELSCSTQVIYFTHHRHLCEIARRVCKGVKVQELPVTQAGTSGP